MKKRGWKAVSCLTTAALVGMMLAGCGGGAEQTQAAAENGEAAADDKVKVTFITTETGLGDRSFNDSTWEGVQRAEQELGVEISLIEPKSVADTGTSIISAVNSGSDLILGFGASWTDAFDEYCERFPDVYFGGLNCSAQADNLQVAKSADHEGSFLAGALAAMMSESGTVGCIGGQDADNINRFIVGYEEGAQYINPEIEVLKSYVGSYTDPAKGKEYSLQLMGAGADVIFQVAAGTGEGVFEAAKENESLYAIGVDSDQDYIVEGKILTSVVKNCGNIAYDMIKSVQDGTFESGEKVYNLANGGVGLTEMQYTKDLIGEENLGKLDEIKEKIISGEIQVTDIFEQQ